MYIVEQMSAGLRDGFGISHYGIRDRMVGRGTHTPHDACQDETGRDGQHRDAGQDARSEPFGAARFRGVSDRACAAACRRAAAWDLSRDRGRR